MAGPRIVMVGGRDGVNGKAPIGDAEAGAERSLELLFEAEAQRIVRALVAYTGDREIASDAMVEAFAQALGSRTELRSPRGWVWRVAFRVATRELKARNRSRPLVDSRIDMPEPPLDLLAALSKLSPNQRAALVLRHYVGYSTREIAQILGSSAATVRVHMSQGRRRLRRHMEDDHE